mgnify:CR=1 FL=1
MVSGVADRYRWRRIVTIEYSGDPHSTSFIGAFRDEVDTDSRLGGTMRIILRIVLDKAWLEEADEGATRLADALAPIEESDGRVEGVRLKLYIH